MTGQDEEEPAVRADEHDPAVRLPDHQGTGYQEVLGLLHRRLRPRTYLEIGTAAGATLALARCRSIAVDPAFRLARNVVGSKPACLLYQQTSDSFFAEVDVEAVLGAKVDLAFLDGLHHFEVLLRDFRNTEAVCRPSSVIVLHDCLPCDAYVARRDEAGTEWRHVSEHAGWWAGDVWKTLVILKAERPDLTIVCWNAPPTGLVTITGLDPRSRRLREEHDRLVAAYSPLELPAYGLGRLHEACEVRDTAALRTTAVREALRGREATPHEAREG